MDETKIVPVQVAYRGFQYGLPIDWVYESIERALKEGAVSRPDYTLWPRDYPITVEFTRDLVDRWKQQYDHGTRMEIPRELGQAIDTILGVYGPRW